MAGPLSRTVTLPCGYREGPAGGPRTDSKLRLLQTAGGQRGAYRARSRASPAQPDRVYLVGARDNRWTLEALDWATGESAFHYVIGGQRYNSLFAGTLVDEAGRVHYGTPWGRVRLNPRPR